MENLEQKLELEDKKIKQLYFLRHLEERFFSIENTLLIIRKIKVY